MGSTSVRVTYVEYAGDVIGSVRSWLARKDDPTEVSLTFSGQFLDAYKDHAVQLVVPSDVSAQARFDRIEVFHTRVPFFLGSSGIRWHVGQVLHAFNIIRRALAFGTTELFVSSFTYLFLLAPLALLGTRIVVIFRTCPRHPDRQPRGVHKLLYRLNIAFMTACCVRVLAHEPRATALLAADAPRLKPRIIGFLPSFRADAFARHEPPPLAPPFRLLFVGRLTREKGIYDLVEMTRLLRDEYGIDCVCDVCGDGPERKGLCGRIDKGRLAGCFCIHGKCDATRMHEFYASAHICIVPTRSECGEGFNMVVAEAVLHQTPVVSSRGCPSVELVAEAVLLAEPDNPNDYASRVASICRDSALYRRLIHAAGRYRDCLLDESRSFKSALRAHAADRERAPALLADRLL